MQTLVAFNRREETSVSPYSSRGFSTQEGPSGYTTSEMAEPCCCSFLFHSTDTGILSSHNPIAVPCRSDESDSSLSVVHRYSRSSSFPSSGLFSDCALIPFLPFFKLFLHAFIYFYIVFQIHSCRPLYLFRVLLCAENNLIWHFVDFFYGNFIDKMPETSFFFFICQFYQARCF